MERAVRDYLKRIWKENVQTHSVPATPETVRNEAIEILEVHDYATKKLWWW